MLCKIKAVSDFYSTSTAVKYAKAHFDYCKKTMNTIIQLKRNNNNVVVAKIKNGCANNKIDHVSDSHTVFQLRNCFASCGEHFTCS